MKCYKCGNTNLRIKDHGKWVGWYCPKCGAGGSKQKNQKPNPYMRKK